MSIFSSKWLLAFLGICIILLILYVLGHKTVHTEITIPAPPAKVWAELSNASGFKEWNPVLIPVDGEFRKGVKLKYKMIQPDGKTSLVDATVVKMKKERLLNQYGGIPGILTFDHSYLLEPVDGGTKLTQHEEYRGIWVLFWDPSWVQTAYEKANEALKKRVEINKQTNGNSHD